MKKYSLFLFIIFPVFLLFSCYFEYYDYVYIEKAEIISVNTLYVYMTGTVDEWEKYANNYLIIYVNDKNTNIRSSSHATITVIDFYNGQLDRPFSRSLERYRCTLSTNLNAGDKVEITSVRNVSGTVKGSGAVTVYY